MRGNVRRRERFLRQVDQREEARINRSGKTGKLGETGADDPFNLCPRPPPPCTIASAHLVVLLPFPHQIRGRKSGGDNLPAQAFVYLRSNTSRDTQADVTAFLVLQVFGSINLEYAWFVPKE